MRRAPDAASPASPARIGIACALLLGLGRSVAAQHADPLSQCAECHPSQAASYAETGMARALEALRPGELAGLAPVLEASTGWRYSFEGELGAARVVESATGGERAPARDSLPIAFAIGAGELDRSYVLARGSRLWLAPLEVLGRGETRHAAFSPAHAITPGRRFTLAVTPECLACHTDLAPPRAWPLNQVPSDWQPRGISCAACHGKLAEHVRFRAEELEGREKEPASDPLLSALRPGRVGRMERCAACHLQGDARIELDPARIGPPPPGTDLLAARAVFVAREPRDEIGFVSHVQRLVLSRCYLESGAFPDGGLSCESCHDPHRSVFAAGERARVRAACLGCHAEREGEADKTAASCTLPVAERAAKDCVDCHMRRTGVFDVAEVEIHDHWIRRVPGAPSARKPLRFAESAGGDWRVFTWPDEAPSFALDDPGPWTMALSRGGHDERALEFLRRGLGERAKDLPMLHHVRGSLLERSGALGEARAAYQRALELDPELAESAINLGPLLAQLGEARAGLAVLDGLITRHPLADTAHRNRAVVRLALGDEQGALADLETAMRLTPDATLARTLARIAEQRGDADGARRWSEEAGRLGPR